jgi:hypothetical protein
MSKILVINYCDDCPHFDNSYYSYNETCAKLDRIITRKDFSMPYPIPSDCPLKDAE